jgi:ribosome biogenesis protein Tsr3
MSEENKCNCKLCELHNLRTKALESDDINLVKNVLEKFADLWLNADFDRSYYMCILDGSWPQAEEILTRSLEKARSEQTNA